MVGTTGREGYFNQNSDAMVAQYQIANIYLNGNGIKKDLIAAYLWANNVISESKGKDVFYCCEFEGGRWIPHAQIKETLAKIESEMSAEQKKTAESLRKTWKVTSE